MLIKLQMKSLINKYKIPWVNHPQIGHELRIHIIVKYKQRFRLLNISGSFRYSQNILGYHRKASKCSLNNLLKVSPYILANLYLYIQNYLFLSA